MTAFEAYLQMSWTSEHDECEAGCGTIMDHDHYVEGDLGHYCSQKCVAECESETFEDSGYEHRQMGITF